MEEHWDTHVAIGQPTSVNAGLCTTCRGKGAGIRARIHGEPTLHNRVYGTLQESAGSEGWLELAADNNLLVRGR